MFHYAAPLSTKSMETEVMEMLDVLFRVIVDYGIVCIMLYAVLGINAATLPREDRGSFLIPLGVSLMAGFVITAIVFLAALAIGRYALPVVVGTVALLAAFSCVYFRLETKRQSPISTNARRTPKKGFAKS